MEATATSSNKCASNISAQINLRSLDALRGLLATYVLLGHARWLLWAGQAEWSRYPHSAWEWALAYVSATLRYGYEAVMVFFVLSGFFIHLRAAQQAVTQDSYEFAAASFFRRRIHRLVPAYLLALGLTVALDSIGRSFWPVLYHGATGDALLDENFARKGYSIRSVAPALLMLPSSLGRDFGSNGPLWSLAFEVIYYLLYPGWLWLRRRGAAIAYGSGVGLAVTGMWLPQAGFLGAALQLYPVWLAGAALAEILCRRVVTFPQMIWGGMIAAAGFGALHFNPLRPLVVAVYVAAGAAIVLIFARLPEGACRLRLHELLRQLGVRSYTVYICHFPMLALISAWVIATPGGRPISGWLAAAGALLTLAVCTLCFELCEKHFLHPRLRIGESKQRAAA